MLKTFLAAAIVSSAFLVAGGAFAQDATTTAPMMNKGAPGDSSMQNGTMQGGMMKPTSPSANGSGALKDNADAHNQKMMQQQNPSQ